MTTIKVSLEKRPLRSFDRPAAAIIAVQTATFREEKDDSEKKASVGTNIKGVTVNLSSTHITVPSVQPWLCVFSPRGPWLSSVVALDAKSMTYVLPWNGSLCLCEHFVF